MSKRTYPAMFAPAKYGFAISFPDLPGCIGSAETLDGAVDQAGELLRLHLEAMAEDGDSWPDPQHMGDRMLANGTPPDVVWAAISAEVEDAGERVNVYLPKSLLKEIERFGNISGVDNRSTFFRLAARNYLRFVGTDGGNTSGRQAIELTSLDSWFRFWMPYCFVRLLHPEQGHVWLPLNRNYKPLGILSKDWVKYEDFIDQAIAFQTNPAVQKRIWANVIQGPDEQILYLYDDGVWNRADYFVRLERLMGLPQAIVAKLHTPEIAR